MQQEIWKLITGYKGRYVVSNLGVIKNVLTKKEIKQSGKKGDYKHVRLFDGEKWNTISVHRIVASQFMGKSNLDVNHVNLVRDDNRLCNLEFVTKQQNARHYWDSGALYYTKRKIMQYVGDDLVKIWENISDFHSYYGGDISEIKKCLKDKKYRFLGYRIEYEVHKPILSRKSLTA